MKWTPSRRRGPFFCGLRHGSKQQRNILSSMVSQGLSPISKEIINLLVSILIYCIVLYVCGGKDLLRTTRLCCRSILSSIITYRCSKPKRNANWRWNLAESRCYPLSSRSWIRPPTRCSTNRYHVPCAPLPSYECLCLSINNFLFFPTLNYMLQDILWVGWICACNAGNKTWQASK